jgi:DNA-directed RNA polymerase specialized sigma24 family protein
MRWLEARLAELDPSRSLLIAMRFRLGATLEHIGRVVGLGPGAVDGRIGRSLAQMRAAAQEHFDEP